MNDLQKSVNVHRLSERVNDFPTQLGEMVKSLFYMDTGVNGKGFMPTIKKVGKIVHPFTRAVGYAHENECVTVFEPWNEAFSIARASL